MMRAQLKNTFGAPDRWESEYQTSGQPVLRWACLVASIFFLLGAHTAPAADAYYLIDNFSAAPGDSPAMVFSVDTAHPKVGLGALHVDYTVAADKHTAEYVVPDRRWTIPVSGKLKFWVKGDGSGNELQFTISVGGVREEPGGGQLILAPQTANLPPVKLDSTEWQEITLDVSDYVAPQAIQWLAWGPKGRTVVEEFARIHAGNPRWLSGMRVIPVAADANNRQPPPVKYAGAFELDDMRLVPVSGAALPKTTVSASLLGPAERELSSEVPIALDVRNFTANNGKLKVHLAMTDADQKSVADRDVDLTIAANESKEFKLDLSPESIGTHSPPFRVHVQVASPDLPSLASASDVQVQMSKPDPMLIIEDFSAAIADAEGLTFSVDTAEPRVGLGALKVQYAFSSESRALDYAPPEQHWVLPSPGKLVFWLKGDGSNNELQFSIATGTIKVEPTGQHSIVPAGRSIELPRKKLATLDPIKLDSTGWRRIVLDVSEAIPENTVRLDHADARAASAATPCSGETAAGNFARHLRNRRPVLRACRPTRRARMARGDLRIPERGQRAAWAVSGLHVVTDTMDLAVTDAKLDNPRYWEGYVTGDRGRVSQRDRVLRSQGGIQNRCQGRRVHRCAAGGTPGLGYRSSPKIRRNLPSMYRKAAVQTRFAGLPIECSRSRRPSRTETSRATICAARSSSMKFASLRLRPPAIPAAAVSAVVFGPMTRDFTTVFPIALDARNFTGKDAKFKVRLSVTDRNQNAVADKEFDLSIGAHRNGEFKLELTPDNIGNYLPPFHVTGDVISRDVPDLESHIDLNVVMSNSKILFDNLSDVNGRWLTRGYVAPAGSHAIWIGEDLRSWNMWTMGEAYRAQPFTQTSVKISRVAIERPAGADSRDFPPDRFAMKFEYNGDAAAYTGFEKFLPGNAVSIRHMGEGRRLQQPADR